MVFKFLRGEGRERMEGIEQRVQTMLDYDRHEFDLAMSALLGRVRADEVNQELRETDQKVNRLEREIRRELVVHASVFGGIQSPAVLVYMSVVKDVERIGDYAKNIAKRVDRVEDRKRFEPLTLIPAMAEVAAGMVHDVLTAFAARDPVLAREVIERDEKVDAFYDSIFRNLVSYMVENPATISSAAQLLFVARNIERIGDHATNVAEMVHFAALGTLPPDR